MKGTIVRLNLRRSPFAVKFKPETLLPEVIVVKLVQGLPYVLHGVLKTGSADEPVLLRGPKSKCLDGLGLGDELRFLDRVTQSFLEKESQRRGMVVGTRMRRTESTISRSLGVAKARDATARTAPREKTGFIVKNWLWMLEDLEAMMNDIGFLEFPGVSGQ